ncbi:uncharacterized protein LOC105427930 [Pogonomyrmex barbatus]|uniref:Uncharacterized protein LOC105427930 n=1 Tax=Pogonomyrmex barbatus TaxID=144034 RepID=A0A6I9WBX0_9HYME|nr:uncharacterized protein LOC105427930 [Pogonomyrmex barbatus]
MLEGMRRVIPLVIVAVLQHACSDSAIRTNEKRHGSTNDYQMCLESFDIHKDKIIRTQDSRDMGAKYLNVLDVDSRLDCLKYCCETERCDVFIFEEKKPSSCYLFQCGPLHDFKCKFTRHANYTSAVRTSYPIQNVQVEEEVRISQQEHELKSLRKSNEITPDYGFTETPAKSIVTQISKVILTTPMPIKPGCHRNQYECRSSGDCIAIYNVCDGIPQCADGSDEAADLVCPTEKPTIPPLIQIPNPPADILQYQQIVNQHKPVPPYYPAVPEINPKTWDISNLAHQMSQPQNVLYPGQSVEVPQMQIHKNYGSSGYQWDYQPLYEQNKDPFVPANTIREQNINPYEQQPHIFNHKGPSVIGNNEVDRGLYVDSKHPYPAHFPLLNKPSWQENPVQFAPSVAPSFQHKQATDNAESLAKITTTPACDTSEEHKNELINENKESVKQEEKTNIHPVLTHVKTNKQITEKPTLPANVITKHNRAKESKDYKTVIVIEEHAKAHERTDVIAERLQIIENDVLRPKGAVISLSLGLIATTITAALIVCRLRVVKRRGRCGHGPFAHDADYLVNGMYL